MEKKLIFVGMRNREIAFEFMNVCIDSLHNREVDIIYIDHYRLIFRTLHTEVRYICYANGPRCLGGDLADAIFGREEYRCWLKHHAKPDAEEPIKNNIGLCCYIDMVEDAAKEIDGCIKRYMGVPEPIGGYTFTKDHPFEKRLTDTWVGEMWPKPKTYITTAGDLSPFYRHMMNSFYGKFPEQPGYYLNANRSIVPKVAFMFGRGNGKSAMCREWMQAVFDEAVKNGTVKTSLTKFRDISREDVEQILKQGADPLIQQKLYAALMKGENNMTMNDYMRRDIEGAKKLAEAMRTVNQRPKLPGIKTVHFSGPVTAVIWEDKTKTIVRCKDGEEPDYEKGLAMAIAKKALGTNKSGSNYYDIFKKWLPKPEVEEPVEEENQDG